MSWEGLEEARPYVWHRQLHIFEVPFYYIEYGIAQLGALQLWLQSLEDPGQALAHYRQALALASRTAFPMDRVLAETRAHLRAPCPRDHLLIKPATLGSQAIIPGAWHLLERL